MMMNSWPGLSMSSEKALEGKRDRWGRGCQLFLKVMIMPSLGDHHDLTSSHCVSPLRLGLASIPKMQKARTNQSSGKGVSVSDEEVAPKERGTSGFFYEQPFFDHSVCKSACFCH